VNETNAVTRHLPESVEVTSDGTVVYRQRYVGPFTQPLHLQSFPFDKQTFRVRLIAVRYTPNEVNFVPDQDWVVADLRQAGGISPSITLPDWAIKDWNITRGSITHARLVLNIRVTLSSSLFPATCCATF
jgi:hypothetical protein